jgi:hypothetical protein
VSAIFLERLRKRLEVKSMVVRELLVLSCNYSNRKSGRNLIKGNPSLVDEAFMVKPIL